MSEYLYLTTIGRKSGKPHEIEIWFVEHEGNYYLVSEHYERSHWVLNIQANPQISFRVGDQTFEGVGRVISSENEIAPAISAKMDAKYGWSEGLIVELKPES